MRLAIDCRHEGGIGTVVRNLVAQLDRHDGIDCIYLIGSPTRIESWGLNVNKCRIIPFEANLYSLTEQMDFPGKSLRGIDLLYIPHYNVPVKRFFMSPPCVVTIHDLAHFSKYLRLTVAQKTYAYVFFRTAIGMAKWIVTDSEFSRHELIGRFGNAEKKTSVIHLAVNHDQFFPDPSIGTTGVRLDDDEPYILTAASVRPHKNLKTLLKAFEQLKRDVRIPHKLVIVGKREGFRIPSEQYHLDPEVERHVIYSGFIRDEELRRMYSRASCFVYPSFYEGFGFPPLEAMACGAPVVCSNAASLPEVVGDAAILCDPSKVDEFVIATAEVLSNGILRSQLIEKSRARAREFSWTRVADKYVRIFQSVAS